VTVTLTCCSRALAGLAAEDEEEQRQQQQGQQQQQQGQFQDEGGPDLEYSRREGVPAEAEAAAEPEEAAEAEAGGACERQAGSSGVCDSSSSSSSSSKTSQVCVSSPGHRASHPTITDIHCHLQANHQPVRHSQMPRARQLLPSPAPPPPPSSPPSSSSSTASAAPPAWQQQHAAAGRPMLMMRPGWRRRRRSWSKQRAKPQLAGRARSANTRGRGGSSSGSSGWRLRHHQKK